MAKEILYSLDLFNILVILQLQNILMVNLLLSPFQDWLFWWSPAYWRFFAYTVAAEAHRGNQTPSQSLMK
jgi:hypothetical protein